VGAFVDTYFSLPIRSDDTELDTPSITRVFDAANDTFSLAYAELTLTMPAEPVGFRLDLGFGAVADAVSTVGVDIGGTTVLVPDETYKNVQQAYATMKVPGVDKLTLDVGRFVTTAGAEVIESKDNFMYSRSLLFGFAIPFTHTGLRASYALTSEVGVQLSLVNGWDVVFDNNRDKTLGASVSWSHADTAALLTWYGGTETPDGAPNDDYRSVFDLVVTQKIDGGLTLNLNADYGFEGDFAWYGVAAMGRYEITEALRLALRAEYFADPDGFRLALGDVSITEITANVGWLVGKNAELRLEGRIDIASEDIYGDPANSTQPTIQFAALAYL
jgi:hypothetical protein